jgi:hypothetical protein
LNSSFNQPKVLHEKEAGSASGSRDGDVPFTAGPALDSLVIDPGIQATCTAFGVERITGYGPFQGGMFKSQVGYGDFIRIRSPGQKRGWSLYILPGGALFDL